MTREELTSQVLESNSPHFIVEACTGFGKTSISLHKVASWYKPGKAKILVLVPKRVLFDSWKQEIIDRRYKRYLKDFTFSTYASIHKHAGKWDVVICDEVHHLTDRCKTFLKSYKVSHFIGLSATLKDDTKWFIRKTYTGVAEYVATLQSAISEGVLPEPDIYLMPLYLDNTESKYEIKIKAKRGSKEKPITIYYKDKIFYRKYTGAVTIKCTAKQYIIDLESKMDYYKRRNRLNMLKYLGMERLKFLAKAKHDLIVTMLNRFKKERVLVFSSGIEESGKLGCPCVNSKVGIENATKFNEGKINHIAAVNQLDEGANLIDCKVGIFQMINAAERLSIQRTGRLMRHKSPVIIIPYYLETREQSIVNNWIKDYPNHLKHLAREISDIKL